ncbi:hypothetical protein HMPREF9244_00098 [Alloscardovia omnicolens F0580]|uniref:Uncharacterized protein n=1 Tax=Alloscardovia omnicolens F0580 TaxID=1321816 RepID=U1QWA5_9BIFI|nr:hypothetical protein HMPREF9244_00098 [Alloscardovia omnicolens F0580]
MPYAASQVFDMCNQLAHKFAVVSGMRGPARYSSKSAGSWVAILSPSMQVLFD